MLCKISRHLIQVSIFTGISLLMVGRPAFADGPLNSAYKFFETHRPTTASTSKIAQAAGKAALHSALGPLAMATAFLGAGCSIGSGHHGCGQDCVAELTACDDRCHERYEKYEEYVACSKYKCDAPYNQCCTDYENSATPGVTAQPAENKSVPIAVEKEQVTTHAAKGPVAKAH